MAFDYETCRWCRYRDKDGSCIRLQNKVNAEEAIESLINSDYIYEELKKQYNRPVFSDEISTMCDAVASLLRLTLLPELKFVPDDDFKCKYFE